MNYDNFSLNLARKRIAARRALNVLLAILSMCVLDLLSDILFLKVPGLSDNYLITQYANQFLLFWGAVLAVWAIFWLIFKLFHPKVTRNVELYAEYLNKRYSKQLIE